MLSKRDTSFEVRFVTVLMLIPTVLTLTMSLAANAQSVNIIRFKDIGNNADRVITEDGLPNGVAVSPDTHHCVATGWSAKWDINEDFVGDQQVWTYVKSTNQGERWFVRVIFNNDDNDTESPDVDVVCFQVGVASFQGDRTLNDPD